MRGELGFGVRQPFSLMFAAPCRTRVVRLKASQHLVRTSPWFICIVSTTGSPARGTSMITELEFKSLQTQGFNRIPLVAEAFADLETPLSLYLKLAHSKNQGKHSFLLESVVGIPTARWLRPCPAIR
jgi:hypothetical protein